ncbi:hypothetical protein MAR_014414 [Mya arenaria]|uniref:Uncharacterized protein n=1 Tax=Mya arenaria TaxID=6604 RepID=A0ABY7G3G9_MYAAR|nr:hypothetical protein MAR_014414 [Mya arenaria]
MQSTSKNASRNQACDKRCAETDQYPGGGTADTYIFSFYTVENVPPSEYSQDIDRNCLLFYYNYSPGHDYYWKSCTLKFITKLLCSSTSILDNNSTAEIHFTSNEYYAKAVGNCVA